MDGFDEWHATMKADFRGSNGSSPPWLHNPAAARGIYEDMRAEGAPTPNPTTAEVAALRARVARLEARLTHSKAGPLSADALVDVVTDSVGQALAEDDDRIKAIEQREPLPVPLPPVDAIRAEPALHDAGIWASSKSYKAGDLVSDRGQAWVAQIATKGVRPGSGAAWRLIMKGPESCVRKMVREELARSAKGSDKR